MRPVQHIALLLLASLALTMGSSCREQPQETNSGTMVADSTSTPLSNGWQEIHTQDGGVMKGELQDGQRKGPWTAYFADGMVRSRANYVNGVMEGHTEVFHENGMTYYTGHYRNGQAVGEWLFYDRTGELIRTAVHDSLGKLIEQH